MRNKRIWCVALVVMLLLLLLPQTAHAEEVTYYGRQALSELTNGANLVEAYDAVVTGVEALSETVVLVKTGINLSELKIVMDAYVRDHTEHFWYNGYAASYYQNAAQKVTKIKLNYLMNGTALTDAQAAMEASIQSILSGITESMSDYEKELYLHDALVKKVTYAESTNAHNAYGALVEGVAVCEGYAEALQVLLHRVGIQSFQAYGVANGGSHAWNYVNIDGSWYHTDPTWNDPNDTLFHAYFNMSDAMITEDHSINTCSYALPVCSSADAHYYTVTDASFSAETYTVEKIAALMKKTPWTANVYITDDVNAFIAWINDNFSNIYYATGATDIDFSQCGMLGVGREMQIFFTCMHSSLTYHAPVTGNCITPGNNRYYSCDACGTLFGTDQTTVLDEIPYVYSDHNMVDGFCTVCQVVTSDGVHYPSLEQAAQAGGSYVRLNFDLEEAVYVPCSIWLDLNGKHINGDLTIADGAQLYLFDSATAGYDATDRGRITGNITGTVAPSCNTPSSYGCNYKYLTLVEADGTVSAHRYYLAVRSAILNPYQVADGYTGSAVNYSIVFKCSDFLAAHVTDWGVKLTGDKTVYAEAAAATGGQNTCVTALVGTLRDNNSEEQNLQNAEKAPTAQGYIRLLNGTELLSVGVQKSVKDLVTYADAQELTFGQKLAIQKMYSIFSYIIDRWDLDITKYQ